EGVIQGEERRLLHKILEFGDKTVRDICVPRTKVVALPDTARFADLNVVLREHKLSRLPIYRGALDNIIGILHAKDLFDLTDQQEKSFRIEDYLDPPFLVSEFKPADELLREMRRRRTHMAGVGGGCGGAPRGVAFQGPSAEEVGSHPGRVERAAEA